MSIGVKNIEPGLKYPEHKAKSFVNRFISFFDVPAYTKRNPSPQPTSLERAHFDTLFSNEYVVADKSDGNRYTLYLDKQKDKNYSFMINRKLDFYQVPIAGSKNFFTGSVFDGELVISTRSNIKTQIYLVFDVFSYMGDKSVRNWSYFRRLELIRKIFDLGGFQVDSPETAVELAKKGKLICGGNAYGLCFRPKPCYPMCQLDCLLRFIENLSYDTDGIIFTPADAPVEIGTAEKTFKLKKVHTIDLEISDGILYVGMGGYHDTAKQRCPIDASGVNYTLDDKFMDAYQDILNTNVPLELPHIIECRLEKESEENVKIYFVGIRKDKVHPNNIKTVLATFKNVKENIKPEELLREVRGRPYDTSSKTPSFPPFAVGSTSSHGGANLANVAICDALCGNTTW